MPTNGPKSRISSPCCNAESRPLICLTVNNKITTQNELVFLLDVDNTLLDDDKMQTDFYRYFDEQLGHESRDRYDAILGELWDELGYCD